MRIILNSIPVKHLYYLLAQVPGVARCFFKSNFKKSFFEEENLNFFKVYFTPSESIYII